VCGDLTAQRVVSSITPLHVFVGPEKKAAARSRDAARWGCTR
jgi:hypothetical protein